MITVGVVGCGLIAGVHSWCLKALARAGLVDARIAVVSDMDRGRAERMASHWDAEVVAGADDVAAACDVVWVCTWTSAHLEAVRAAVGAGRAVFCEKPLGPTLSDAAEVAEALSGVPHLVGLVLRRAPVFRELKQRLASGRDGAVLSAAFRDDQYLPTQGIYESTWRTEPAAAGGGTLIEHSIHDVDLLQWLIGPAEAAGCLTRSALGHEGIDDVAAVTVRHAGGAVSSLHSVWHLVLSRGSTRRLEVFAEKAVLWLEDDFTGPLYVQTDEGVSAVECPMPAWADAIDVPDPMRRTAAAYGAQMLDFLDAVAAGRGSPGPLAGEALSAHAVVDAAYRSAAAGGAMLPVATT